MTQEPSNPKTCENRIVRRAKIKEAIIDLSTKLPERPPVSDMVKMLKKDYSLHCPVQTASAILREIAIENPPSSTFDDSQYEPRPYVAGVFGKEARAKVAKQKANMVGKICEKHGWDIPLIKITEQAKAGYGVEMTLGQASHYRGVAKRSREFVEQGGKWQ